MKTVLRNTVLSAAVMTTLLACGGQQEEAPPPAVRPVKIFTVEGVSGAAVRNFPGAINASQRAEVSFRVSGSLQEILVKEGDNVEQGQVLARLDPTDFEIVLKDRQALFDNANSNFNRAKELIVDGNISKLDYDRMEANFRTSQAALAAAKQDLEYTQLKASFTGRVARREVENFEEVMAKQTIFHLQNVDQLDVTVDLSENLIRSIRRAGRDSNAGEMEAAEMVTAVAQFEGKPEQFPLAVKEAATKADPQTQTFRLTFSMDQPKDFNVLPGMTANVVIDLSKVTDSDQAKWIPLTAVVADSELDARVWILDPKTMTVSPRAVTIGRMSGRTIEISEGLYGGEEVVSVGAAYLAEGMLVSRMLLTEQAQPRPDDPA
jgi:RND family efflux transporter MFP subunit